MKVFTTREYFFLHYSKNTPYYALKAPLYGKQFEHLS